MNYKNADMSVLVDEMKDCQKRLDEYVKSGISLDLSRGKPSAEQLELSLKMLDVLDHRSILDSENGTDCRNYGGLDGIPEAKRLLAHIMGTHSANTIVGGNSSLTMMFQIISHGMTDGICGNTPWQEVKDRKFLCPVPGYDRHFAITEHFGFELVPVKMNDDGPDMDEVEKLIKDDKVKGIWCVPKYQNPMGIVFSDEVVRRFAHLKPAAEDFRIFWDNAYSIHHLYDDDQDVIPELLTECEKVGTEDMVYKFISTSKVSFPGSGIAAMAASEANLNDARKWMHYQTIGHDKLNQLRHVRFFKDMDGMHEHMRKHAAILRPKFELVQKTLEEGLGGLEIGSWTKPKGGYFISFDSLDGCAKRIVSMAKEAGLVLTGAGATYPYGKDPKDCNIRIAPSFPTLEELGKAAELFVICVKLASAEKLLGEE